MALCSEPLGNGNGMLGCSDYKCETSALKRIETKHSITIYKLFLGENKKTKIYMIYLWMFE